jgi:hypothetical protein
LCRFVFVGPPWRSRRRHTHFFAFFMTVALACLVGRPALLDFLDAYCLLAIFAKHHLQIRKAQPRFWIYYLSTLECKG